MMEPRQRLLATLGNEPHDRVPLVLEALHYRTREEIAALDDPAAREIAERVFDESHYSVHCDTAGNRYLMTPRQRIREVSREETAEGVVTTREIDTPRGPLTAITGWNPTTTRTTWTIKYPCETLEDIEKIRSIPWETPAGLAPPEPELPEDFARRGIVRAGVSSPFVCVAGMMPYEYFLELCATHLDLIGELTDICLRRVLATLEIALSNRRVEYLWMGGSEWVTPPMGSPKLYEALVQEQERAVIERAHEAGALAHVHCHGNVRTTLELTIERGGDFLEPMEPPPDGDVTLAEAKRIAAGRIALGGNIESRILENESVEATEAACRAAFEGPNDRLVFQTTAGPIGRFCPRMLANYHRMIDVWEELSPLS